MKQATISEGVTLLSISRNRLARVRSILENLEFNDNTECRDEEFALQHEYGEDRERALQPWELMPFLSKGGR